MRLACNAFAPLLGRPVIGRPPGAVLPDVALTHLVVPDRDPAVLAALLDVAVGECLGSGRFASVSLCLFDDDPLRPALDGYWHRDVAMDLYAMALEDGVPLPPSPGDAFPGFEFYLA